MTYIRQVLKTKQLTTAPGFVRFHGRLETVPKESLCKQGIYQIAYAPNPADVTHASTRGYSFLAIPTGRP